MAGSVSGAFLEPKLVGQIDGRFFVARYQRGYRWGKLEVERLLNDIWDSKGHPYTLQPVVVKRKDEGEWELVDGQQRLTTLYLIFLFMQHERLKNIAPRYSITYETRSGSETYLQTLDPGLSDNNIDFYHLYTAYDCIRAWFNAHGNDRQYVADKFYIYLFESVQVIWYEAPHGQNSTDLFRRLNIGRIPLTDAELVKALLLTHLIELRRTDRAHELATQWDNIERDLRDPDVWAFIADIGAEDSPTRINLLLDTLAGCPLGRDRPRFYTFDKLRQKIEKSPDGADEVWNQVVDMHGLILGWFHDRNLYHKIGYLVAVGQRFSDFVKLASNQTKSHFEANLDALIRDTLDLRPSDVTDLSYEKDAQREKCARLLLLMNVETVCRLRHSKERYSFRSHREGSWSLEHIHAQNAESLTTTEQWREWLRLHREALIDLPSVDQGRRRALIAKIDAVEDPVRRETFQDLAREVTAIFTLGDASAAPDPVHSLHSISNLALLSSGGNSALGNAVFEVKRRRILQLDRMGEYIPICTRQVFLKYYTDADSQQVHFWSVQDRETYLQAMISPEPEPQAPGEQQTECLRRGVIFRYLKPEEK